MTQHTKGPWAANWSKYREETFVVQAGMPSNRVLASFDGDGDGPDEQSLADAHLISASPELLDALKAMVHRFELYAGENDIHAGQHDKALLEQARAAIAKATGAA